MENVCRPTDGVRICVPGAPRIGTRWSRASLVRRSPEPPRNRLAIRGDNAGISRQRPVLRARGQSASNLTASRTLTDREQTVAFGPKTIYNGPKKSGVLWSSNLQLTYTSEVRFLDHASSTLRSGIYQRRPAKTRNSSSGNSASTALVADGKSLASTLITSAAPRTKGQHWTA
jgi:hypothetical protein